MKITIFSSNQPRHINLARQFSKVADQVYFISEGNKQKQKHTRRKKHETL